MLMPWGDTKTVEEAMRYVDFDSMIFTHIDDERKDIRNETIKYSVHFKRTVETVPKSFRVNKTLTNKN